MIRSQEEERKAWKKTRPLGKKKHFDEKKNGSEAWKELGVEVKGASIRGQDQKRMTKYQGKENIVRVDIRWKQTRQGRGEKQPWTCLKKLGFGTFLAQVISNIISHTFAFPSGTSL